jgi:hypothetical protein
MKVILILLLFITFTAAAHDKFLARWEDRVNQSENPDAKACDMCRDWCWDHKHKLAALDEATLREGEKIATWMENHGYALPAKAQAAYGECRARLFDRELAGRVKGVLYCAPASAAPVKVPASTTVGTDYNQDLGGEWIPPPVHGAREP